MRACIFLNIVQIKILKVNSITNEHTLSQEDVRRYLEDESKRMHEILSVGQELSLFMKTNKNEKIKKLGTVDGGFL